MTGFDPTPIDPLKLAEMDKTRPLRCSEQTREQTCALCGGPLSPGDWSVRLVARRRAHPHCAADAGWTVT